MVPAGAEMLEPLAAAGAGVGPLTSVSPQVGHQLWGNK